MAKNTSIILRDSLEMLEQEEAKKAVLIKEFIKGEKSGFANEFNRDTFL